MNYSFILISVLIGFVFILYIYYTIVLVINIRKIQKMTDDDLLKEFEIQKDLDIHYDILIEEINRRGL